MTADVSDLHARLEAFIATQNMRWTKQRQTVTDVFFRTDEHVSSEELLGKVRQVVPKIGHATIYRTLRLLSESGLADERQFGDGVTRYEVSRDGEHHDHMICMDCGHIEEFESDALETLQERIAADMGYTIEKHTHELYVRCKREACPHRNASS